jgi:hypothetical protein
MAAAARSSLFGGSICLVFIIRVVVVAVDVTVSSVLARLKETSHDFENDWTRAQSSIAAGANFHASGHLPKIGRMLWHTIIEEVRRKPILKILIRNKPSNRFIGRLRCPICGKVVSCSCKILLDGARVPS